MDGHQIKLGQRTKKVCPTCGKEGIGAYLKCIPRKSKSRLRIHHYYCFAHYAKGNRLDWCYVGKTLANAPNPDLADDTMGTMNGKSCPRLGKEPILEHQMQTNGQKNHATRA